MSGLQDAGGERGEGLQSLNCASGVSSCVVDRGVEVWLEWVGFASFCGGGGDATFSHGGGI